MVSSAISNFRWLTFQTFQRFYPYIETRLALKMTSIVCNNPSFCKQRQLPRYFFKKQQQLIYLRRLLSCPAINRFILVELRGRVHSSDNRIPVYEPQFSERWATSSPSHVIFATMAVAHFLSGFDHCKCLSDVFLLYQSCTFGGTNPKNFHSIGGVDSLPSPSCRAVDGRFGSPFLFW